MIGAPAGIAVVLAIVAVSLHHHNRKKRTLAVMIAVSLLFTVAAFFAVLAFTPSLGPVWAYTGDGPGLVTLLSVAAASGIAYYHHLRHRENFHTHGTPVIGAVLAVAAGLALLNIRHVSGHALGAVGGSWRGAGTAFASVNSGRVIQSAPATVTGGSHGVIIAVVIIVALLLLVKVARSFGGRNKGGTPAGPPSSAPRGIGR
jgi:hypothetical protein